MPSDGLPASCCTRCRTLSALRRVTPFCWRQLSERFFTVNVMTNTVFWTVLGLITTLVYRRLEARFPPQDESAGSSAQLSSVRSRYWALDAAYRLLGLAVVAAFFLDIYMSHSHARLTHANASYLERFGHTIEDLDTLSRLLHGLAGETRAADVLHSAEKIRHALAPNENEVAVTNGWMASDPVVTQRVLDVSASTGEIAARAVGIVNSGGETFVDSSDWYRLRHDIDLLQIQLSVTRHRLIDIGRHYGENAARQSERLLVVGYALLLVFPLIAGGFVLYGAQLGKRINFEIEAQTRTLQLALANAKSEQQAKRVFLQKVHHEVHTPLTVIIGYCELLLDELGDSNPKVSSDLRKILVAARRLFGLMDNSLNISSIDAGAGAGDGAAHDFDVRVLVSEMVEAAQPFVRQQSNVFTVHVDPAVGRMVSDPDRIKQVLIELLSNAGKFTQHGEVLLNVSVLDDAGAQFVVFEVRDTGLGIRSDHLSHIFKPFFQVDSGSTSRPDGAGLGLAMSRAVCELLGGRIDVQSEPGTGSTFTVILPRDRSRSDTGHIEPLKSAVNG